MSNRIELCSGSTIKDVYASFCDSAYGTGERVRSRNELRAALHAAGYGRYEDCGSLSVSECWAFGESENAEVRAGRSLANRYISSAYTPRFVTEAQLIELVNLYHLARTALAGLASSTRHQRIVWAASEFHREHPEVSETGAYKDLSDALTCPEPV